MVTMVTNLDLIIHTLTVTFCGGRYGARVVTVTMVTIVVMVTNVVMVTSVVIVTVVKVCLQAMVQMVTKVYKVWCDISVVLFR